MNAGFILVYRLPGYLEIYWYREAGGSSYAAYVAQ
jgi:hypothetical protein